ncbi:hypothetical protein C8J57DRAFT_1222646 [Mycena rebaudengoi]|nr:hypothetical protein C8J57DRAFT_1222646 [Mycena rebaudengoi]
MTWYEATFRVVQEMVSMLMPTPRILSSVNLRSTAMLLEYAQLWGPVSKTAGSDGSCGSDILRVGAEKRSKECAELGPAPSGFSYIQIGDNIHLTATDGNGSTMYIAHAASVRIVHN